MHPLLSLLLLQQTLLLSDGLRTSAGGYDEPMAASFGSDEECPAHLAPLWSMVKVGAVERSTPRELLRPDMQLQRALYRFERFSALQPEAAEREESATALARQGGGPPDFGKCRGMPRRPDEAQAAFQQRLVDCLIKERRRQSGTSGSGRWPRRFRYQKSTTWKPPMAQKPSMPKPKLPYQPISPVQYRPELFQAWKDWQQGPAEIDATKQANGRLAIILTGLVDRLIFPELLKNVVRSTVMQGYQVDLFISLIMNGNGAVHNKGYLSHFIGDPLLNGLEGEQLTDALTKNIELAGGRIAKLEIQRREEDLEPLPEEGGLYKSRKTRMTQYSPYTSEVGRNVLRRYKTLDKLMHDVGQRSQANGQDYKWVLELREDLLWINPLDLSRFNATREPIVYGIDCLLYGGINDKALLYSQSAGWQLSKRYSAFYNNSHPLLDNCGNAESYLGGLVTVLGVPVTLVPVNYLGAVSAMYRQPFGELQVCVRKTNQMKCVNPYYMPEYCDPTDHTMMRRRPVCTDVDA